MTEAQRELKRQRAKVQRELFVAWCRLMRLPDPVAEHRFHPTRNWRVDWAWPDARLALEVEGGLFGLGKPCPVCGRRKVAGHTSIQRLKDDLEKYNELALAGWRLVRVQPTTLTTVTTADLIRRGLEDTR